MGFLHSIIAYIVEIINSLWYLGIFAWMFLESSFFPFPSEIIMIPAWYLASNGQMNIYLVIIIWILWSLAWSWLNYLIAMKFGRKFLEKFVSIDKLDKLDKFFEQHGHISTFNWRLIPVIRQYISFPAGLSKMNWWKFTFYTWLWAGIWVTVLSLLWFFLWKEESLWKPYLREITIFTLVFIILISVWYYFYVKKKNNAK